MSRIRYFREYLDLILVLVFGIASIALSTTGQEFPYPRWIVCFSFAFFLAGYPLVRLFFVDIGRMETFLLSAAFSTLFQYPAALLNILLVEQKDSIFRHHLMWDMIFLFLLAACFVVACFLKKRQAVPRVRRKPISALLGRREIRLLVAIILLSSFLNVYNLNRTDVSSDQYGISFIAYDLVDGNVPGRDAYAISFKGHSPLIMYISHFSMNILNPFGYYNLEDWMTRFAPAIFGVLSTILVFLLGKRMFSSRVGLIAALIFSTSNYVVCMSRILHREMVLTFFMLMSLYFFYRFYKSGSRTDSIVTGIMLGSAMMVKLVGAILAVVFLLFILLRERPMLKQWVKVCLIAALIFSPVVVFNVAAYVKTGYTDVAFSTIFGTKSYMGEGFSYRGPSLSLNNFGVFFADLIDQYSVPLFFLFGAVAVLSVLYMRRESQVLILLLLILIGALFHCMTGPRTYYMVYLTAPFALVTGFWVDKYLGRKLVVTVVIVVIAYSSFYMIETNFMEFTYHPPSGYGEIGDQLSEPLWPDFSTHFSRTSRSMLEAYGCKELRSTIKNLDNGNHLVVIDNRIHSLSVEWYLTGKDWKLNYGGTPPMGFLEKNSYSWENLSDYEGGAALVLIGAAQNPLVNSLAWDQPEYQRKLLDITASEPAKVIYDSSGIPAFYVYLLEG